jgi:hypothetical protein
MARGISLTPEHVNYIAHYATPGIEARLTEEIGGLIFDLDRAITGNPVVPCPADFEKNAVQTQLVLVASFLGVIAGRPWIQISRREIERCIISGGLTGEALKQTMFFDQDLDADEMQRTVLARTKVRATNPNTVLSNICTGVVKTPDFALASSFIQPDQLPDTFQFTN